MRVYDMHGINLGKRNTGQEVSKLTFDVTPSAKTRSIKYRNTFPLFFFFFSVWKSTIHARRIVLFWKETRNLPTHTIDDH